MDPTASVIAIATAAWNVIQYLQAVKKGGRERQHLENEVLLTYQQFRGLEDLFGDEEFSDHEAYFRPINSMMGPNGAIPQLKATLDEITTELGKASKHKVASTFLWPFRKDDVNVLISRLHRLTVKVTAALSQVNVEQGRIANLNISEIREAVSIDHFQSVLEWISSLDFISLKDAPAKMALLGTGRWFLDGNEFKLFSSGIGNVLWCPGIPGAGKTCLALSVVEELVAIKQEKAAVLMAFCAFDNPKTHSAVEILWSLLRQVVKIKGECSARVEKMYSEHVKGPQTKSRPGLEDLCQVLSEELEMFETVFLVLDGLDEMPDHSQRADLLERLQALEPFPKLMVTSRNLPDIEEWFTYHADTYGYQVPQVTPHGWCEICGLHITSHYYCSQGCDYNLCHLCRIANPNSVCEHCKGSEFELFYLATVDISASSEDIEQYVNSRIDQSGALKKVVSRRTGLREDIISRVKDEAQDMFLLARFHMDVLETETSPNGVRNALQHLPKGITETFDETFRRIDHRNSNDKVKRLITFVAYSNKLLTVEALNHAIAIKPTDTMIDEDDISLVDDLVPMCAGFVTATSGDYPFLRLAHETIRQYITQSQTSPFCDGDRQLAIACLTYLQFSAFDKNPTDEPNCNDSYEERQERFPFLTYAALYWGVHAKNSGDDEVVKTKTLEFLRSQPHVDNAADAMFEEDGEDNTWEARSDVAGIHVGAYFGLTHAVSQLIADGTDPDSQDCLGTTALMYAVSEENSDLVEVLLKFGASVGTICQRGSTALHRAVVSRNVKVVQQLVASTQDISINALETLRDGKTALMLAVEDGTVEIVNLLLQRKEIDVSLPQHGPSRWNALLIAASYDRPDILKSLIVLGKADVNLADNFGTTPLMAAAELGHTAIAELLLKYKANPDLRDKYGRSAFFSAVKYNNVEVIRLFIKNRIDWSSKDFLGGNVLHCAAHDNQHFIMRLLLEQVEQTGKGARLDEVDDEGETPLFCAARYDFDECVEVLLEFSARTDVLNNAGVSPVWSAREMGATRVLPLLRERRNAEKAEQLQNFHLPTRADTFGDGFKMSLHSAARLLDADAFQAHLDTYRPGLLEALSAKEPASGYSPLHIACWRKSLAIVNMIISAGSPLEIHDQSGWTPMHLAAQQDSTAILEALIRAGADVNSKDLLERTPIDPVLHEDFCVESSFLLIEHGAKFDIQSSNVWRLMHHSAAEGNLAVTKILVDRGVPKDFKDSWGLTPYQLAKQEGHAEVADILRGPSSLSTQQLVKRDDSTTLTLEDSEVRELEDEEPDHEYGANSAEQDSVTEETKKGLEVVSIEAVSTTDSGIVDLPPKPAIVEVQSGHGGITTREMVLLAMIVVLVAILLSR